MGTSSPNGGAAIALCSRCGQPCAEHVTHFRGALYCAHCWQELQRLGVAEWLPSGRNGHLAIDVKETPAIASN